MEQARNEAKSIKSNQSTPSKKNDLSGILSRPAAATNEVDFSFGGPVADEGGMKIGYKKGGILILYQIIIICNNLMDALHTNHKRPCFCFLNRSYRKENKKEKQTNKTEKKTLKEKKKQNEKNGSNNMEKKAYWTTLNQT